MRLFKKKGGVWDGWARIRVKEQDVWLRPGDHLVVHHTDTHGHEKYYELSFHEVTAEAAKTSEERKREGWTP